MPFRSRRLLSALAAVLVAPLLAAILATAVQGADDPVPSVSFSGMSTPFIGQQVSFDVSFVNSGPTAGYGPYVDLQMPRGADLDDGLTFVSATYLGLGVTTVPLVVDAGGCITHPYALTAAGTPLRVCSLPVGESYVVLRLPFGSFTPGQPAATLHVVTTLSDLADAGYGLDIVANGGFQFGKDPLDNPTSDPSTVGDTVTTTVFPTVMRITKTYNGPENETATGPNYPRSYTINVSIAPGQWVDQVTITDQLPDSLQFIAVTSANPSATGTDPSTSIPGGTLTRDFGLIKGTGGVDASLTFSFYVPDLDASGDPIVDPLSGAAGSSTDSATADGTWTPIDPRDDPGPVTAGPATHTLTDRSIAIQKSVRSVSAGGVGPDTDLEWTLSIQVSDYVAWDGVGAEDLLGDGMVLDSGFTPTLAVDGNGFTSAAADFGASGWSVEDGGGGQTLIHFRINDELVARGLTSRLVGGCLSGSGGPYDPDCTARNDGATTVTIVYRSVVLRTYHNGREVVEGDTLHNWASAVGTVEDGSDFGVTGLNGDGWVGASPPGTHASVSIDRGSLKKTIYAINGNTSFATPVHVAPGDTVTYRLKQTFPASRTDDYRMVDYLPLPVLHAIELNGVTFDPTKSPDAPAAGHAKYGPDDSFHDVGGPNPTIAVDTTANSIEFAYGDFALYPAASSVSDLLFTVTISTDPFADGLLLTNQARSETSNSAGQVQTADAIIQITLDQPVATITKGVVASDDARAVFNPTTTGPVSFAKPSKATPITCGSEWTGPITSADLDESPIDSDASGLDAGDLVRFAITIRNTGHAGAFEVKVQDDLPAGFVSPAAGLGGLNLCAVRGDGTVLSATNINGTGLLADGIQLVDPTVHDPDLGDQIVPALQAGTIAGVPNDTGSDVVIVTFTLQVDKSAVAGTVLTDTASLLDFTNSPGSHGHLAAAETDTASITIASPTIAKSLVGTSEPTTAGTNVAIGETLTYKLTLTVPEGTLPDAVLTDQLPSGLAIVTCTSATPSPAGGPTDLSTNLTDGFAGVCEPGKGLTVGSGGQSLTFDLGTVVNANQVDATPETIEVLYTAIVLNVAGNQAGTPLVNSAQFSWSDGSLTPVSADTVTVVEPDLSVTKTATASSGDAADVITYTLVVANDGSGNSADGFDVVLSDAVPTGMTYIATSFRQTDGYEATGISDASAPTLTATWRDLPKGQSATFTYQVQIDSSAVASGSFPNTARLSWTSLPGDVRTHQSDYNSFSVERTGSNLDIGGSLNDYKDSDLWQVDVPPAAMTKNVIDTSDTYTSGNNVAVGEIVTYEIVVTIPEGRLPAVKIVDSMPGGLALVACDSILSSNPAQLTTDLPGGWNAACAAPTDPTPGANGQHVTFTLGNVTNANTNNGVAETLTIHYRAVVLNVASNKRTMSTLTNGAVLTWTGGGPVSASAANLNVLEPKLTVTKSADKTSGDARDVFTFTINITNDSDTNGLAGFEVVWTDRIPDGMTYVNGSLKSTGNIDPTSLIDTGKPTLTATWDIFAKGGSATLEYKAALDDNVPSGSSYPNNAVLTWTSLPGDVRTHQSDYDTTESTERTGSTSDPGGSANTYTSNSPVTIKVNQPTPTKTLSSTSEPRTSGSNVEIGEIGRYRVVVVLPEGVTANVSIRDSLPAGLRYLNDGTTTIAFVTDYPGGGITSTTLTDSAINVSGNESYSGDPAYVLPASAISGGTGGVNALNGFNDGDSPVFSLGNLINADSDTNQELIVIEFNVLVDNVAGNTAGHPLGDSVSLWGGSPTAAQIGLAGSASLTVFEPYMGLTKTVSAAAIDAGSSITYTITIWNNQGGVHPDASPAYEYHVRDDLPGSLDPLGVGVKPTVTCANGFTDNSSGSNIDVTLTRIDSNTNCTIVITTTVVSTEQAGKTFRNTANATYTSLPGTGTPASDTVNNPTGSSTPGASGDPTGERNGNGTSPNSYTNTGFVDKTLATPTMVKNAASLTQMPIGSTSTFDLVVTLPEGTTSGLKVTDTLPVGLIPVSYTVYTTAGHGLANNYCSTLNSATQTAIPAGSVGGPWTWTFGDQLTECHNTGGHSKFSIEITVQMANRGTPNANTAGTSRSNSATVYWNNPNNPPGGTSNASGGSKSVTVYEPALQLVKSVNSATPHPGDTVTYTLVVSHKAGATDDCTAYDIAIADTMPTGLTFVGGSLTYSAHTGTGSAPALTEGTNSISIAIASLPVGSTETFTYQATLGPAGTINLNQSIPNSASATWTSLSGDVPGERTGADGSGGLNNYVTSTTAPLLVSGVDLSISKTDGVSTAQVNQVLTYTISYQNTGNQTATGVVITETVPTGTIFQSSGSSSGWSCPNNSIAGTVCTISIGSVSGPGNGSRVFKVVVVDPIPASLALQGHIVNTATIADGGAEDSNLKANNTTTDDDTVVVADLSLAKAVDNPTPNADKNVVFTITLTNAGPSVATTVTVLDQLPAGLTYVSSSATSGSYDSASGVWSIASVPVGSAPKLTITAQVKSSSPMTNVAEVTHSDQGDPNSTPGNHVTSEDDYATASLRPNIADLAVTKVSSSSHPDLGSVVVFTIVATNNGDPADPTHNPAATGVWVSDPLPAGLSCYATGTSATKGTYDPSTGVWTIGTLAVGASETLTLAATVTGSSQITNTATVHGDPYDPVSSNDSASTSVSQLVDLWVTKTVDDPSANVGSHATFTVTVSNIKIDPSTEPDTAHGVVIHDLLPVGLTFVSATPDQGTYDSGTGDWTVGTVNPDQKLALQIEVVVASPDPLTNTASVKHVDETQSRTDNDSDSATVTPPQADLKVTKTVSVKRLNKGDPDSFTITVKNLGPDEATNITISDPLAAGLTFVSATPSQGSYDDGTGVWTVGSLDVGASATLTIDVTVSSAGDYTNMASVSHSDQYDPDPSNNSDSASLSTKVADLAVTKTVDNPTPTVKTTVQFTVTVKNLGPDGATQVVIGDLLPAGLSFVSATPSQGNYVPGTGVWTLGSLALDDTATIEIAAQVDDSGTIENTASVASLLQRDPDPTNDSHSADLTVPPAADLSLSKSVDNPTPDLNSDVTFTVTVTNHGPDGAGGIVVSDLLPAGLTYVSDDGAGSYDSATGTWTVGSLAVGSSVALHITATVMVEGQITNVAEITSCSPPDPDATSDTGPAGPDGEASVSVNSRGVADLSLSKQVTSADRIVGGQATYQLTLHNAGPDNATGVTVDDQLPAGLSYISSDGGSYNPTTGVWTVGGLAAGGSASLTITVRLGKAGEIDNVAEVMTSDQRDPNSTPNDGVASENDEGQAVLSVGAATAPPTVTSDLPLPALPSSPILWLIALGFAGLGLIPALAFRGRASEVIRRRSR